MKKIALSVLLSLGVAGSVSAQTASEMTCDDVVYHADILAEFPEINEACQEVVMKDGEAYTRIDGKLKDSNRPNRMRVQLMLKDGTMGPTHYVRKTDPVGAMSDGEKVAYGDLAPNSPVTVYLPHDRFDVMAAPSEEVEPAEVEPEMLPETATNIHLLGFVSLMLVGFAGIARRFRKA
jgi:hypothetical protein